LELKYGSAIFLQPVISSLASSAQPNTIQLVELQNAVVGREDVVVGCSLLLLMLLPACPDDAGVLISLAAAGEMRCA
jgi:hypothetical protein